ncbi:Chorion peroxidase [Amphibalanus amphitrite]|uniref:Chorion peroxidase n=1 Tax=Amphibalanus amphitrite TaxID=1232801 RepID=A0A6A4V685_AMPAM|nr:Chorion peroxidase [Amphibalanus amphitrite]
MEFCSRGPEGGDGSPLPSARLVSSRCASVGENAASGRFTLSVMQWGQFIDHDITHVPVQRLNVTSGVNCCSEGISRDRVRQLPECFPIDVPADDPFYSRFRVRCLNFLRSIPALRDGCGEQPAQQVNQITHWLDGSNVYGSSAAELAHLRRARSHLMRTSAHGRLPRMPHGAGEGCAENNGVCFRAGDTRVNEQISLTAIHNIWVTMHNRIADTLRRINPRASAEDIFQESRAVNVALMQRVIYSEWLPIVLGADMVRRLGLDRPGRYRADLHPGIVNEFAAAAFRFGHSLVAGMISVPGRGRALRLSDVFFNPGGQMQQRGMLLSLIRGLISQPAQRMDSTFSREIVGLLFRGERQHGLDLVALNIQRGRDHGIGTYSQTWAALQTACPQLGDPPTRWEHLNDAMTPDRVAQLRAVYRSVEDVDLFVGGVAEEPAGGALVGPTFQCLLAEQFTRLKYADRHFYNHESSMFSDAQLDAIDAMSWSAVLCEAFPKLGRIQENAFFISRRRGRRCRRTFTMEAWRNVLPRRR